MYVLRLIEKLIPLMHMAEKSGGGGTKKKRRSTVDWGSVGSTLGAGLASIYNPDPLEGDMGEWREDAVTSSLATGFATSAALGFADFGLAGAATAITSFLGSKSDRERAQAEQRRRERLQWERALTAHQNRLTDLGRSISQTEKQVSMAKITGIAEAAGQGELALDARIAAASGRGTVNITELSGAASSKDNLEASLMAQEGILGSKLKDLEDIQKSIAREKAAKRDVGTVATKEFDDLQSKIDLYEKRYS